MIEDNSSIIGSELIAIEISVDHIIEFGNILGYFCVLVRDESFMYLKQGYLDIIGCIWIEEEETEKLERRNLENRKDNV